MDLEPDRSELEPKRRRIVIEDEDEVGSNPDELIDNDGIEEEDEEGEDLMGEGWRAYVLGLGRYIDHSFLLISLPSMNFYESFLLIPLIILFIIHSSYSNITLT